MDYISAEVLHKELENVEYTIIDVRDYDFDGKVIKGAHHVPFDGLGLSTTSEIKSKIVDLVHNKSVVVVHCALSQVRGPKSARIFKEAMPHVNFVILRGGYEDYSLQYPADIVNLNKLFK